MFIKCYALILYTTKQTFNISFSVLSSSPSSSFSRATTGHHPLQRLFLKRFSVGTLPSFSTIFSEHLLTSFDGFTNLFRFRVIEPNKNRHRKREKRPLHRHQQPFKAKGAEKRRRKSNRGSRRPTRGPRPRPEA